MAYITKTILLVTVMMNMNLTLQADTIDTIGQAPYEQCGYCHEFDGNSKMSMYPKLAGQTSEYLVKQLKDFRSAKRKGSMQATAELLSDEDIQIVAQYFSQQKISVKPSKRLTTKQYEMADSLFLKGDEQRALPACSSCHGIDAEGNGKVPRLANQHESYLYDQLSQFKAGTRNNDRGEMQRISRQLTENEISILAVYLSQKSVSETVVGHIQAQRSFTKNIVKTVR